MRMEFGASTEWIAGKRLGQAVHERVEIVRRSGRMARQPRQQERRHVARRPRRPRPPIAAQEVRRFERASAATSSAGEYHGSDASSPSV
jgi:hypothetical protein